MENMGKERKRAVIGVEKTGGAYPNFFIISMMAAKGGEWGWANLGNNRTQNPKNRENW
jgi:hypothetical protein